MTLPKYIFKEDASKIADQYIAAQDISIGDTEIDSDSLYYRQAFGGSGVTFFINQDTGKVKVKYSNPEKKENNEWYTSHLAGDVLDRLKKHVVESNKNGGGSRRVRKNRRKTRKN